MSVAPRSQTIDDGNDTTETKLLSVINAPQCHSHQETNYENVLCIPMGPQGGQMGLISKNGGVKISLHCRFN